MFSGSQCGSVEVTEAGGLAGFLHEGAELELLPGQEAYMLQQKRGRVIQAGKHRGVKCVCLLRTVYTGGVSVQFLVVSLTCGTDKLLF